MKLNLTALQDCGAWANADIALPSFDIEQLRQSTTQSPQWLHFGGGNIFRVFIAATLQDAIEAGRAHAGIITVETFDEEIVDAYYKAYDCLSLSVIMDAQGGYKKRVIATVTDAIKGTQELPKLRALATEKSLKMVSFTITEKGYAICNLQGDYLPIVAQDIEKGPEQPTHTMSIVASLLYDRYRSGEAPIAMVSMDNCSHNGDKLKNAVIEIAEGWIAQGHINQGFLTYLQSSKVSFPLTMIDKITPRPAESVQQMLEAAGLEDMHIITTQKGSYTAPFVNAESAEYLIIEDDFPNGKIDIASDRVIFTSRDTVNQVETMKVTTCLNPLHTALAVTGCLLRYTSIAEEMKNETLVALIYKIGYDEGLPVVTHPGILDPKAFIDEVVQERLPNSNIPDTPQRIAMDTSQKVGIRFGETIKSYMKSNQLDPQSLVGIPLAIAAWCRYLLGVDDNGNLFEVSSDPLYAELSALLVQDSKQHKDLAPILSNKAIFGVDLYAAGLGEKIQSYFNQMLPTGGVLKTLQKELR